MDSIQLEAAYNAIRDRVQYLKRVKFSGRGPVSISVPISLPFAIHTLASRSIPLDSYPPLGDDEQVWWLWSFGWYEDYCKAVHQICCSAQRAVAAGQIQMRSPVSRALIDGSELGSWPAADLKQRYEGIWEQYHLSLLNYGQSDPWPDNVCLPPDCWASLADIERWAVQDGIAAPGEITSLLFPGMEVIAVPQGNEAIAGATQPEETPSAIAHVVETVLQVDVAALPWIELARLTAWKIIKHQRELDLYPSQEMIADQIASEFRKAKPPILGTSGKPMTGAYIKRHALKGISSSQ